MNKIARVLMNTGALMAILGFSLPFLGVELGGQVYNILQLGGVAVAVVFWVVHRVTKVKS